MAKTTLINKKTSQEVKVDNPDYYLKKYKGVFSVKPAAEVSKAVKAKEQDLETKSIDVKDAKTVSTSKGKKQEK